MLFLNHITFYFISHSNFILFFKKFTFYFFTIYKKDRQSHTYLFVRAFIFCKTENYNIVI